MSACETIINILREETDLLRTSKEEEIEIISVFNSLSATVSNDVK